MRLSIPGAVLLAGVLVLAGFLAHAALPRYETKTLADGTLVRVDRWTASSRSSNGANVPEWSATVARTPWPARISRVTVFEGTVLLAAGGGIASWRVRRAWRVAQVRRRLHAMVASDSGWLQRV
jgi:hypothetical protein